MLNTNFSVETAKQVMEMYEARIEALLSKIEMLEIQLENSLKQQNY